MTCRTLILFIVSILAVMSGAQQVQAADLPTQRYRVPAAVAPMAYNWTGLYLGVMGGYAKGTGDYSSFDGMFLGGTIGYNWQAPGTPFVFGVEADYAAWTNWGYSLTVKVPAGFVTLRAEADAIATLRARAGAAFEGTLIYVTGGGAWLRNTTSASVTLPGLALGTSDSETHFGYAVGGGVEQAFGEGWTGKVEYLYLGLGSENYFPAFAGGVPSGNVDMHTVKIGINYRFPLSNW